MLQVALCAQLLNRRSGWRRSAKEAFEEATVKAMALREIATEHEQKQKLAERLFNAKMRRGWTMERSASVAHVA